MIPFALVELGNVALPDLGITVVELEDVESAHVEPFAAVSTSLFDCSI